MATVPPQLSDESLAQQVQMGERQALGDLIRRHSSRFYRAAYGLLKDKGDAEDMVQNAFLKFWKDPAKWDPNKGAKFTTWFYRVVINLSLDHLKKRKPILSETAVENISDPKTQDKELVDKQRHLALECAITDLPERQRVALNLCFYEGLSNLEAAEIMGLRLKALQSLLMRAKGKLKSKLKPQGSLG